MKKAQIFITNFITSWNYTKDGQLNDSTFETIEAIPDHFNSTSYVSLAHIREFIDTRESDNFELLKWNALLGSMLAIITIEDISDSLKKIRDHEISFGTIAYNGLYYSTEKSSGYRLRFLPNYLNLNKQWLH